MGLASEGEARTHTASLDTTLLPRAISYMPPASPCKPPSLSVKGSKERNGLFMSLCDLNKSFSLSGSQFPSP